jgi:hypothetical protein
MTNLVLGLAPDVARRGVHRNRRVFESCCLFVLPLKGRLHLIVFEGRGKLDLLIRHT